MIGLSEQNIPVHDVTHLLKKLKIDNAVVRIRGAVELDDIAQALLHTTVYKPMIVLANKIDVTGAEEKLRALKAAFSHLPIMAASAVMDQGMDAIPQRVFEVLKILRIYTKRPRQAPAEKPMIMPEAATVGDAAKMIHKDFYHAFKYARLWGSSMYPGERVGLSRVLQDKDVLEIHV